ncbi:universal stress protein [Bowmanella dokdonensis]|uniref:Universal stress protein n=1 Tax=Bowmanella dokdonensis TaxID=751969 RepID=A0A939DRL0_9ALTE|nr:universal stress protein [Bowmanella dokdonensis]MBN7826656.1 universal stress protein [Bowmanella dokdonensis]
MLNYKHILFLSDPEQNQDACLLNLKRLHEATGATITLLQVLRPPTVIEWLTEQQHGVAEIRQKLETASRQDLQLLAGELERQGATVYTRVKFGKAYQQAIELVEKEHIDLLLVNGQGAHGLQDRLFGSTAMHLIRKCPCAVLAVKPHHRVPPSKLLAAVDINPSEGFESSRRSLNPAILQTAQYYAGLTGARMQVIQAWQLENEGYLQVRGGLDTEVLDRMRRELKREYQSRLKHFCDEYLDPPAPESALHVVHGIAASVIAELVEQQQIDLLVMGTVSREGLVGVLIGNTAEELLQTVDCSVLVIKPKGFKSPLSAN